MSRKLKYYDEFDLKEINSFFEKLIASKNDIKELTKEKLGLSMSNSVKVELHQHSSISDILVEITIDSNEFDKTLAPYTSFYNIVTANIFANFNKSYRYIIHLKIQGFVKNDDRYKQIENYLLELERYV